MHVLDMYVSHLISFHTFQEGWCPKTSCAGFREAYMQGAKRVIIDNRSAPMYAAREGLPGVCDVCWLMLRWDIVQKAEPCIRISSAFSCKYASVHVGACT
eukprot:1374276-Amphidinium_carterae.1